MKEPIWVEERDALAIHARMLSLYGGATGLRDRGLLQSALARPQQHFAYSEKPDVIELAAIYTAGLVRNHPFGDGNKRVGFVAGVLFLEMNGYCFSASEEEAAKAVMALAAGEMGEDEFTNFLRAKSVLARK